MKKPSVPPAKLGDTNYAQIDALKQNIDILTGKVGGKMTLLSTDPNQVNMPDILMKINEIINKLQG